MHACDATRINQIFVVNFFHLLLARMTINKNINAYLTDERKQGVLLAPRKDSVAVNKTNFEFSDSKYFVFWISLEL